VVAGVVSMGMLKMAYLCALIAGRRNMDSLVLVIRNNNFILGNGIWI